MASNSRNCAPHARTHTSTNAHARTFSVVETRKNGFKCTEAHTCIQACINTHASAAHPDARAHAHTHTHSSTSLRPLAEKYKACDDEYEAKQSTLVAKVIGIIATYAPAVEQARSRVNVSIKNKENGY